MIHIEFMGPPGAGKTTIRRQLVERLKKVNRFRYMTSEEAFLLVARHKIDRFYRIILNILPRSIAINFVSKVRNRSIFQFEAQNSFLAQHGETLSSFISSDDYHALLPEDRQIVIGGFLEIAAFYQAVSKQINPGTYVFNEEGFVQKAMMFVSQNGREGSNNENLFRYLSHIPHPDWLIYVKADQNACLERMKLRADGLTQRLKGKENKIILEFLKNSEIRLEQIIGWMRENSPTKIVQVDNNVAIEYNVQKLMDIITRKNEDVGSI